ncbi:MAG TPA: sugar-binding protein [Draconibacterium sp.]|nr:sugar-binding protein [Draconibacterium sp.]
MKHSCFKIISLIAIWVFFESATVYAVQDDTVRVQQVTVIPLIDGIGNDEVWNVEGVSWQSIDQVWMPWKGTVPSSSDFSGKYKVIWNEESNMLYFLVDIIDDSFIDGYNFASNGPFGYPNYDVVEIFIDEDRSKGAHVFDNGTENAQNALSYHITVNAPADGETTIDFTVEDLDGKDWSSSWVVNYASHFPGFAMKKSGNNFVYEFSLKVFNDTYPTQQKNGSTATDPEKARVTLTGGKIMGMTMAYCDNDANDGKRDHFFGSTPGKEYTANFGFSGTQNSISTENGQKIFNTCWMSANDYGVVKLMKAGITSVLKENISNVQRVKIYPNHIANEMNISIHSAGTGKVDVAVYNLTGIKVTGFSDVKNSTNYSGSFNLQGLKKGIYLTKVSVNNSTSVQKIIKL